MPLNLEQKKAIVADISELAQRAHSVVAAEYPGLSVAQMNALRKLARQKNVHVQVFKNTLARRAFTHTPYACMSDALEGPLVLGFSLEGPSDAARLFRDFAKKNEALSVTHLSIDGKLLEGKDVNVVADLPTREEALVQLLLLMQAPATKLVRTLAASPTKLVRTIVAVRDKKQQDG